MMQFDLITLKLFVAVGDEHAIGRAADRIGIVASAASKRIADLEFMFGVPLLCRQSRGVILTPAGEALLHHARSVIRNLEKIEGELSEYKHGIKGHIRVFANMTAIVHYLPEDLSNFLQKHPLIKIDLEEHISPFIIRSVVESRTDVGIFSGVVPSQGLEVFPYYKDRLALIVPEVHPLAASKGVHLKDILDYDIVSLPRGGSIEQFLYRRAAEYNSVPKIRIYVTSFDAACRMVQSGLGISIIPQEVARTWAITMRIKVVPFRDTWATRTLYVGVREYRSLPVTARLFVDHLVHRQADVSKHEG